MARDVRASDVADRRNSDSREPCYCSNLYDQREREDVDEIQHVPNPLRWTDTASCGCGTCARTEIPGDHFRAAALSTLSLFRAQNRDASHEKW